MEVHESRHESFLQSWRQVEVELYVEVVDTRICDCFHDFEGIEKEKEKEKKEKLILYDMSSVKQEATVDLTVNVFR